MAVDEYRRKVLGVCGCCGYKLTEHIALIEHLERELAALQARFVPPKPRNLFLRIFLRK